MILDGAAHGKFIFQSEQGTRLMLEILRFLLAPYMSPVSGGAGIGVARNL